MIDGNHLLFSLEGVIQAGATRVLATTPKYDHCNFTVLDGAPGELIDGFRDLLFGMSYADPEVRPLLRSGRLETMAAGPYRGLRRLERGGGPAGFCRTLCATGRRVMRVELGELGFDEGGALLIKRALRLAGPGGQISVSGSAPELALHLRSWCRIEGHRLQWTGASGAPRLNTGGAPGLIAANAPGLNTGGAPGLITADAPGLITADAPALITAASNVAARWSGAERAGSPDASAPNAIAEHAPQRWGLAARGALVESGSPEFAFTLAGKTEVWSMDAGRIYAQGAAAQWDPATAVPWNTEFDLPIESRMPWFRS